MKFVQNNPSTLNFAIGIIWLFHLSAMVGVTIGEVDWFIQKTPINLMLQSILLFLVFPIAKKYSFGLFVLMFCIGYGVEYIGVKYGIPFGEYSYGNNLGPKLGGVPLLIGTNWALLVFVTSSIANKLHNSIAIKSILGALFMLLLDIPMEMVSPKVDFWEFTSDVPLSNYISWFVISLFMHLIVQKRNLKGDRLFSLNIYISQLLFFIYLAFVLP